MRSLQSQRLARRLLRHDDRKNPLSALTTTRGSRRRKPALPLIANEVRTARPSDLSSSEIRSLVPSEHVPLVPKSHLDLRCLLTRDLKPLKLCKLRSPIECCVAACFNAMVRAEVRYGNGITKRMGPPAAASIQVTTFGALLARPAASNPPFAIHTLLYSSATQCTCRSAIIQGASYCALKVSKGLLKVLI